MKQTLIILSPGFPSDEDDSTCLTSQQLLVKQMSTDYPGIQLIVLSFQYPFHNKKYKWHGVSVIPFNGRNNNKPRRWLVWYRVWRKLHELHRNHNVIGILSFWCTECSLVGSYFSRKTGIRHITWILGQDARSNNSFVSRIRPQSDDLIAMSDFLQEEFEKNFGVRPAHVVPNGVDRQSFGNGGENRVSISTSRSLNVRGVDRTIDIMGAGSLIPLKNYDLFIELIGEVRKHFPSVRAVLCGDGPELSTLTKKVRHLGLEKNLQLKGALHHDDLIDLMHQSRILLHPSSYEGFSTVCIEALAAGAHVVSSCYAMKEDIEHWHVVKSEIEMKNKVLELLSGTIDYTPIIPFTMEETGRKMIRVITGDKILADPEFSVAGEAISRS